MDNTTKLIDVFSKFYAFDKLKKENKYYYIKKDNYDKLRYSYENNISKLNTYPIRATIQTTEYCNLNCIMCQIHGTKHNRKLLQLSKSNFDKIVSQIFPYLIEVHPTNIGEPLMSNWFDYFIKKAEEYGVLIDLTTNGMLLNEKIITKLLPNLLDIKISFDGINKNTFETIRRGANIDIVLKNINILLERKNYIENKPSITLQMTLMKNNYKELPYIIEFAAQKGIDRVKAFHVFVYDNKIKSLSLIKNLNEFEEIRKQSIKLAKESGIKLEISEPHTNESNNLIYQKCRLLWTECWFDPNGNYVPCHSYENLHYGSIEESDFKDIWNSEKLIELRKAQNNNKPIKICKNCGMNYLKYDENQPVPYDFENFLNGKSNNQDKILWSSRSKQFPIIK